MLILMYLSKYKYNLCMDVVPGLSWAAGLVHPNCTVLIKVPGVKGEESPEQRVLRVVIAAVGDVDPTDKPNQPPPPGVVPEVRVADDSLLVMGVQCGDELTAETQPASLPPGDVCTNYISTLIN